VTRQLRLLAAAGLLAVIGPSAHAQNPFVDILQGVQDAGQAQQDQQRFFNDVAGHKSGQTLSDDYTRMQQDQRLLRYDRQQIQADFSPYSQGNGGGFLQQPAPYGQQPIQYGQQAAQYTQQQPAPYLQQPAPYLQQPAPYLQQPAPSYPNLQPTQYVQQQAPYAQQQPVQNVQQPAQYYQKAPQYAQQPVQYAKPQPVQNPQQRRVVWNGYQWVYAP